MFFCLIKKDNMSPFVRVGGGMLLLVCWVESFVPYFYSCLSKMSSYFLNLRLDLNVHFSGFQ